MSTNESVGRVQEAIGELEKATVPVVHSMIGVAQKNAEQMTASSKEVLQIMDSAVDRIAGAAVRLAATGAELTASVMGGIRVNSPTTDTDPTPKPNR